ncbi:MAG: hypothetical protein WCA98_00920 [Candidatus Acidiferrales bacterium]
MPENSIVVEPGIDGFEWSGIQLIQTVAALAALLHEMGAAKEAQVFRNGRARNGKGLGDAAGGKASAAQEVEHGAAGGIGESAEGAPGRIGSRTVTHNA